MEENVFSEDVRCRLMFAAMQELEEHGIADFSLRRVATKAQVSCAAPYRHYKSREDLILAALRFIREQFSLFCEAVIETYRGDALTLAVELSISEIRFLVANPRLFSVMLHSSSDSLYREEIAALDRPLCDALRSVCAEGFEEAERRVLSKVLGYSALLVRGALANTEETFDGIRDELRQSLTVQGE